MRPRISPSTWIQRPRRAQFPHRHRHRLRRRGRDDDGAGGAGRAGARPDDRRRQCRPRTGDAKRASDRRDLQSTPQYSPAQRSRSTARMSTRIGFTARTASVIAAIRLQSAKPSGSLAWKRSCAARRSPA